MNTNLLSLQERTVFALRELYSRFGYDRYIMSKFEPYDLYAGNKDFLISDHVITFTDTNGQLMALKPDVTLSIVKNTRDADSLQKLYYNENVYRAPKGGNGFREMMQVGLECLGNVDTYCISEVLYLAQKSLDSISNNYLLSVSDLGLLSALLDNMGLTSLQKAQALRCIGEKNIHELLQLCDGWNVAEKDQQILRRLISISGRAAQVLPELKQLLTGTVEDSVLIRFLDVMEALAKLPAGENLNIDFSVVDDIHYYTGFVFKGFVSGIPGSVLSGGEYNRLMQKMHRRSSAIGFAVYLDMLQQLEEPMDAPDADILLLSGDADPASILAKVEELSREGRVLVSKVKPANIRCNRIETM